MTREERAIKVLINVKSQFQASLDEVDVDEDCKEAEEDNTEIVNALEMAIKALEQEPHIDMESEEIKILQKRAHLEGFHEALKQGTCEDCISRKAVLDATVNRNNIWKYITNSKGENLEEIISQLPSVKPQQTEWIPLTTRPMTEEEQEHYKEWLEVEAKDIFDCKLPEDGQEVLISYNGCTCTDIFCKDNDGCYFEGVDIEDVTAWMPLPKPYEPQERSDKK